MARKKNGRAKFLALKATICADLAAGIFAKEIYEKHRQALNFSYRQFLYYCSEARLDSKERPHLQLASISQNGSALPPVRASTASAQPDGTGPLPEGPKRFVHDPTAAYRKKNLI